MEKEKKNEKRAPFMPTVYKADDVNAKFIARYITNGWRNRGIISSSIDPVTSLREIFSACNYVSKRRRERIERFNLLSTSYVI